MPAPRPLLDDESQPGTGSPVQVGQVVSGKYRIERQIGRGGMGIVLAATHLQLGHLVAIKVMRRDLVVDDRVLDRLLMEARAAAKIRNEHVARVLDVGTLENGSPFIVMEYLEGENLADLLDRQGALDIQQAVLFLLQCCVALAEVHAAEMVHRDLKPGNLFIARLPDGTASVKIVDFGISKYIGGPARDGATTTSQQVMGSPFYMSPEQMRADPVDERSDIWGLGAILFEMLTGRPPFIGDTLPEVYAAVLSHSPPAVDTLRPGVPSGLDDVVQRCLEKDPGQRFCDVADLAEALSVYAGPAVWLVERVTRILTNPDAARPRHSLPGVEVAGVVRIENVQQPGEGIMAEDSERDEARVGEFHLAGTDVAAPSGTVLEPGADPELDAPWRPSRPSVPSSASASGEVAPFSATGIHGKRVGFWGVLSRWRFAGLGAGLALVLGVGAVWLARPVPVEVESPPPAAAVVPVEAVPAAVPEAHEPQPAKEPLAAAPAPDETSGVEPSLAERGAAQPKVMPIVAPSSKPIQTRAHALQPAKPPPPKPSAEVRASSTGETSSPAAGLADGVDWDEPNPEDEPAPPRASSARNKTSSGEDPWNPESFGDRR